MIKKKPFRSSMAGILTFSLIGLVTVSGARTQISKQTSFSQAGPAVIKVTAPSSRQTWEKGDKYPIRWESQGVPGEVRILLVRQDMSASQVTLGAKASQATKRVKPVDVVGKTVNSGSYDCVVPGDIAEGLYKVQIMTVDGSVKGTSEGIVAIRSKALRFGDRRKGNEKAGAAAGTAQSAGQAQAPGAAASTGRFPSAGATASKATPQTTAPSAAAAGKSQAAAVKVVKVQVNPVQVSEAELKNLPPFKAAAKGSNLKFGGRSTAGRKIVVTSPKDGDVWEAGKEYSITWESTGITGDVKIDVAANQYQLHPVTGRTVNSGAYLFRVPRNFVGDYRVWRARVSTLDGTIYGWSPPSFTLYSQDVDLQCQINNPRIGWPGGYLKEGKEYRYLQFNVWMRNDGTRLPISIDTVLVKIIKEPQEIVCYQEEWGFGGIYPHAWYRLPDPRTIKVSSWSDNRDMNRGVYRMEVWLDPQNRLGELEGLRQDNKAVHKWILD